MQQFSFMTMLGGLCLFLFGMNLAKEGLQLVAGDKLRTILHSLTDNKLLAIGIGALATAIIQSSTAVTVMLEGFASSGLLTLTQAMGVILGADIGTTVTVQLISLRVTDYALWLVIAGVLIHRFSAKKRSKYVGQSVLGFGFIFYSLALMAQATMPVRDNPHVKDALQNLADYPIYALPAAASLTATLQTSAAATGLVLSLALGGGMTLDAGVPMILGANIGTCATALLASAGSNPEGKRVSYAHLLFKVAG